MKKPENAWWKFQIKLNVKKEDFPLWVVCFCPLLLSTNKHLCQIEFTVLPLFCRELINMRWNEKPLEKKGVGDITNKVWHGIINFLSFNFSTFISLSRLLYLYIFLYTSLSATLQFKEHVIIVVTKLYSKAILSFLTYMNKLLYFCNRIKKRLTIKHTHDYAIF